MKLITNKTAWPCWSCKKTVTEKGRNAADGDCPHCGAELDSDLWPQAKLSNDLSMGMSLITSNEQLEVGREYWCRSKAFGNAHIKECLFDDSFGKFMGNRIWAYDGNSQALKKWDIIGPLPKREQPDFDAYIAAAKGE